MQQHMLYLFVNELSIHWSFFILFLRIRITRLLCKLMVYQFLSSFCKLKVICKRPLQQYNQKDDRARDLRTFAPPALASNNECRLYRNDAVVSLINYASRPIQQNSQPVLSSWLAVTNSANHRHR